MLKQHIEIKQIKVGPTEFARYCHDQGVTGEIDAIKAFAAEESRRKPD